MAEIILAILLIAVGIICAVISLISAGANAFGGATNPSAVDHKPTVIFAALAFACVGYGAHMLLT